MNYKTLIISYLCLPTFIFSQNITLRGYVRDAKTEESLIGATLYEATQKVGPFVEPVFIKTKIKGAIGVFGSAVLSDSVLFIYPRKKPVIHDYLFFNNNKLT